jgi:hypothetical protein
MVSTPYKPGDVFETIDREQSGVWNTPKAMGIDEGFGSSKTAFTVIEYIDNIVHVIYSKQFENSSTEQMVDHAWNLIRKYNLN